MFLAPQDHVSHTEGQFYSFQNLSLLNGYCYTWGCIDLNLRSREKGNIVVCLVCVAIRTSDDQALLIFSSSGELRYKAKRICERGIFILKEKESIVNKRN